VRADQVAQPSGDAVSHDRAADGPAHHETRARRSVGGFGDGGRHQEMDDQSRAADASAPAHGRGELVPAGEPGAGRQHRRGRVRPRAARGPCGGDRREWRARPGCASAAGNRACAPGGGCSAGRCACPCSRSTLPVDGTGRKPAAGLLNVLWTEHAGPRWCSAVHAQRATVDGHDSYQGTQRRERGSNRPCTAQWRNRRSPSVADATARSPPCILRPVGGL
jgi:hypothetical protein